MRSRIDRWRRPIIGFRCHHNIWTALTALAGKIKSDMRWKGKIHSYDCNLMVSNEKYILLSAGECQQLSSACIIGNNNSKFSRVSVWQQQARTESQQNEPSGFTGGQSQPRVSMCTSVTQRAPTGSFAFSKPLHKRCSVFDTFQHQRLSPWYDPRQVQTMKGSSSGRDC